jgi:hypothetical protein
MYMLGVLHKWIEAMDALFDQGLQLIGEARDLTKDSVVDAVKLNRGLSLYFEGIEKFLVVKDAAVSLSQTRLPRFLLYVFPTPPPPPPVFLWFHTSTSAHSFSHSHTVTHPDPTTSLPLPRPYHVPSEG